MYLIEKIVKLSLLNRLALIFAIILVNALFAVLTIGHVKKLYKRTGSREKAMSRLRILGQYVHMIIFTISSLLGAFLLAPLFDNLGTLGKILGIIMIFTLLIGILLIMQVVYFRPIKEMRGTSETLKENIIDTFRALAFTFVPVMLLIIIANLLPKEAIAKNYSEFMFPALMIILVVALNLIMPLFYKNLLKAKEMEEGELKNALKEFIERAGLSNAGLYIYPWGIKEKAGKCPSFRLYKKEYIHC